MAVLSSTRTSFTCVRGPVEWPIILVSTIYIYIYGEYAFSSYSSLDRLDGISLRERKISELENEIITLKTRALKQVCGTQNMLKP